MQEVSQNIKGNKCVSQGELKYILEVLKEMSYPYLLLVKGYLLKSGNCGSIHR